MKNNKIALCVMIALSGPLYATENVSVGENELVDQVLANSFFTDAKLDLILRNQWMYLKEEAKNPKEVHSAWGQGIALDYKSGYFADFIGFDATYYGAVKLAASDYFASRGILYSKESGYDKHNADGYSKFGQRYVKVKYALSDLKFDAKAGWQNLRYFGVLSNSTRLSPNTYQGITGALNYGNFTLRSAYVTAHMERNSPDKMLFKTRDNQIINHIYTGDLLYKSDIFDAQYAYGESHDYLRRNILLLTLKPTSNLTFGSQIYGTKALDRYKEMSARNRHFDDDAWHYAADVKWKADDWSTRVGIGYTHAEKHNEIGFYPREMTRNSRGTFTSLAYAGVDYLRDGETTLGIISDYKLTPQFTVGFTGNYGQFSYKDNTVRTGEVTVFGMWKPSHSKLKNLSVLGKAGPGWDYKQSGSTPVLTNGKYSRAHNMAGEVIIEYKFNIF